MPNLNFKGKTFVQNHHLAVKHHQLVPDKKKSLTDKVSLNDNLIIHGDNLIALKALLPTYAGKIKCIYIDPPYNTGNEGWIYNDNVKSPMIQEWLGKVVDKDDLTRHDKWLCMMMPRLKLLRELLSEEGGIFISCDDNENFRLRSMLDEIFGEKNFVANITIKANPRGRQSDQDIATLHDSLLVYAKNDIFLEFDGFPLTKEDIDEFDKQDDDGKKWRELGLRQRGSASLREDRPDMFFPIYVNADDSTVSLVRTKKHDIEVLPKKSDGRDSRWMWGFDKTKNELSRVYARLIKRRNEHDIFIKDYLERGESMRTKKPKSIWLDKDVNTEAGGKVFKKIMPGIKFPYPKPVGLLEKVLRMNVFDGDIILDSFAGSGTTAHAVLQLNESEGGNRKFILIEQEHYADDITAERVRRVIKKQVEDAQDEKANTKKKQPLLEDATAPEPEWREPTFSYFKVGDPLEVESILHGKNLPSFTEFARYLFYTATGEEFDENGIDEESGFIGESRNYKAFLFYEPDLDWLKSNALTLDYMRELPPADEKKRLVFAPAKYVSDEDCREHNVDFVQLPFEIYRLEK